MLTEERRYKRKGYGLISAIAIAMSFFFLGPEFLRAVWPPIYEAIKASQWEEWRSILMIVMVWNSFWFIFSQLAMWLIYHLEHPFFERYKVNADPWPWQENAAEWRELAKKSIKLACVNVYLVGFSYGLLMFYLNEWKVPYQLSVEDLPDWKTLMLNLTFCMICEDTAFHFFHSMLHLKPIYPLLHKIHHQYRTTVGIAAYYQHPIEFTLGGCIATTLGPALLGPNTHFCTVLMWYLLRTFETMDGHCGYEFSWSPYRLIPFSTSAEYHDFHHSHNVGNYSSMFSFWDTLFGQNRVYYNYQEQAREAISKKQKDLARAVSSKLAEKVE